MISALEDLPKQFLQLSGPLALTTGLSDSDLADLTIQLTYLKTFELVMRVCDGRRTRTRAELFAEFATAFQFPYYFGQNWNAFIDCLGELRWMYGRAYLVCITRFDEVMEFLDPQDLCSLLQTSAKVADKWANDSRTLALYERSPTPFHLLLQVRNSSERRPGQASISWNNRRSCLN
jgi:Barstar (barnase inhibitor)